MSRTLYLPYEIYGREVFGHLHLAEKLLVGGQVDRVIIGNKLILGQLMKLGILAPGVWYLKSAQGFLVKFLKKLKRKGFKIILHDAEAISTLDGYDGKKIDTFMKPAECRELCDAIFLSTNAEHVGLMKDGQKDQMHLVGALRFHHYLDNRFSVHDMDTSPKKRLLFVTSATSLRLHKVRSIYEMREAMSNEGISDRHLKFLFAWAKDSTSICSRYFEFYQN